MFWDNGQHLFRGFGTTTIAERSLFPSREGTSVFATKGRPRCGRLCRCLSFSDKEHNKFSHHAPTHRLANSCLTLDWEIMCMLTCEVPESRMLKKHEQIMKDMKDKTCSELASGGPISVPHVFSWGCWGKTTFFRCFPFSLWPHFRTPWPFPISRGGCKAMFLDNAEGTWSRVQWDAIEAALGCFRVILLV